MTDGYTPDGSAVDCAPDDGQLIELWVFQARAVLRVFLALGMLTITVRSSPATAGI